MLESDIDQPSESDSEAAVLSASDSEDTDPNDVINKVVKDVNHTLQAKDKFDFQRAIKAKKLIQQRTLHFASYDSRIEIDPKSVMQKTRWNNTITKAMTIKTNLFPPTLPNKSQKQIVGLYIFMYFSPLCVLSFYETDYLQKTLLAATTNRSESLAKSATGFQPKSRFYVRKESYKLYTLITAMVANHGYSVLLLVYIRMGLGEYVPKELIQMWKDLDEVKNKRRQHTTSILYRVRRYQLKKQRKFIDKCLTKKYQKSKKANAKNNYNKKKWDFTVADD